MNQEVKQAWLTALRSGNYEQGQRSLNRSNRFCCLGVLCDLAVKAGAIGEWQSSGVIMGAEEMGFQVPGIDGEDRRWESEFLPPPVAEWAHLESDPHINHLSITSYNDGADDLHEHTFEEIAALIEEHL